MQDKIMETVGGNQVVTSFPNGKPRCQFFLPHKRRQCHMQRKSIEKFCSEHAQGSKTSNGRKRIPCPLNPRHSVWEDQVNRHLKKCRAKEARENDIGSSYIWKSPDINLVGECTDEETFANFKGKDLSEINFPKWIKALERLYDDIIYREGDNGHTTRSVLTHPGLQERLMELENQKHAKQQASLIGHMDRNGLLDNPNGTVVAEFGCGRGELSRYLSRALALKDIDANQRFLLIDRASCRMKQDSKLAKDYEELANGKAPTATGGVTVKRLKADIKDVAVNSQVLNDLGLSYHNEAAKLTLVSKHLCGCATDLTIQAITGQNELKNELLRGSVIALCCRQLCSYETYSKEGREWMEATADISSEGFHAITRMTSWALCGSRGWSKSAQDHYAGLAEEEREKVGKMARKVIDYGRLIALRQAGFINSQLVEYIDPEISLENVCLIIAR